MKEKVWKIKFLLKSNFIFLFTEYASVYEKSDIVNDKQSWISTNKETAIWYNPPSSDWMFGTIENIGKDLGIIHSDYNKENVTCPQEIPLDKWKWYLNNTMSDDNSDSFENGGEIHIQCGMKKI